MSSHPTWTAEERSLAVELHEQHCHAECDRPVGWGWLKLARATMALREHNRSTHQPPEEAS